MSYTDRFATTNPPSAAAEAILKPKSFRVVKRDNGFTVEVPVVDYWDAVHALAEAIMGAPVQEPTIFVCGPDGTGGFDMPISEYEAAVARNKPTPA